MDFEQVLRRPIETRLVYQDLAGSELIILGDPIESSRWQEEIGSANQICDQSDRRSGIFRDYAI